jgi:hypothetical protein
MNLSATLTEKGTLIRLRDRYIHMLKNDLVFNHPLRHISDESTKVIREEGGFGAVLSRAGVGKTAFLVQLALHAMLEHRHVLHISLIDPVDKVTLWYKELFNELGQHYKVAQMSQLWQTILPFRFIMTFRVAGFTIPKLQERLSDLSQQDIFNPEIIIIDGFKFDDAAGAFLSDLRRLTRDHGCRVWFSVHTHRHEEIRPDGMPSRLTTLADSFNVILNLEPADSAIKIVPIKGLESRDGMTQIYLDSSTMLISA